MPETEALALLNYNMNLNVQEANPRQHGVLVYHTKMNVLQQGCGQPQTINQPFNDSHPFSLSLPLCFHTFAFRQGFPLVLIIHSK